MLQSLIVSAAPYQSSGHGQCVERIVLKAVCNSKTGAKTKSDPKNFTLHKINTSEVRSSRELKSVIRAQLCDDIVPGRL